MVCLYQDKLVFSPEASEWCSENQNPSVWVSDKTMQSHLIFSTGSQARPRVTPRNSLLANRSHAQGPISPVAECRACTLAFSTYDPSASTPQKPLIKFLLFRFSLKKRAPFLVMHWASWDPRVEWANRREQRCPRPSSGRTWESWGRGLGHTELSLWPQYNRPPWL